MEKIENVCRFSLEYKIPVANAALDCNTSYYEFIDNLSVLVILQNLPMKNPVILKDKF